MIEEFSIEDVAAELDINLTNVYHFNLINGVEIVGEVFSDNADNSSDDKILILNPVKIIRNSWLNSDEQFNVEQYFVEWNPCANEPFVDMKESNILSKTKINDVTLSSYVMTVHDIYYPLTIKFEPIQSPVRNNNKDNVIDFLPYLINKYNN